MSAFTIDGDPISVLTFDGFDLPDDVTRVRVLSNGTEGGNEVLQQGSQGLPEASVTGQAFSSAAVASLRALRASHAPVPWTDPDNGSLTVIVLTFKSQRAAKSQFRWDWSMTLVQAPA